MERENQEYISIVNATENNLKHVSLKIPKKKITVFTGVSGSGKSSLCLDTIAAESRRELNVTFPSFVQQFLPKYGRPEVERMENLPVTIVIDQKKPVANSRSTVGTYTDIYALLRLLFSRVGKPFVGYSDSFSFNHPSGKCERCEGLGVVTELDIHKLVDFDKCLNDEGVIQWPSFTTGAWRWKRYAYSGLFDLDKKIKDYSKEEMDLFLYSPQIRLKNPPANWPKSAKYEGIYPRMYRSIITSKEGQLHKKELDRIVSTFTCPECHGARLNAKIRSCLINGKNICEVSDMPIPEAAEFIRQIDDPLARDIKTEILKRMNALIEIGLSYLSLSRGTDTLSGGEAQRIKIARYINSPLTDMMYVLDEPSVGLHSRDIQNLKNSLIKLKEHGNTVMIVEHHREVIALADHIVDMGPEAGINGGQIMYQGSYENLLKADTVTGRMLRTDDYAVLRRRMLATVQDPQNTGVGIAAPQVGILRRMIAVQRFDKPGEPFEFYLNPEIVESSAETAPGREGCLSIPGLAGTVVRAQRIVLRYRDERFAEKTETIDGFTAVIFQHETDHLDGILYTDRTDEAPTPEE